MMINYSNNYTKLKGNIMDKIKMKNGKYDLFYKHKGHNSYHKLRQK